MRLLRTNAQNQDFINLVKELDATLAISDGDEHDFYDQYNKLDKIRHTIVGYQDGEPIACGAIKHFSDSAMEVKRMYTTAQMRGKGYATQLLADLERWTKELGYKSCVLETGKKQPEAIALYLKCKYTITENYGQYVGVENSVCFEKILD